MRISLFRSTVILAIGATASLCSAAVEVKYKANVGDSWANATGVTVGSGNTVDIDGAAAGYWRIRTTGTSEDLGRVTFLNSTASLTLLIGGVDVNALDVTEELPSAGCRHWSGGLGPGSAAITLQARISGNLAGGSASIRANRVARLDVAGDIDNFRITHESTVAELSIIKVGGKIADDLSDTTSDHPIESNGGRIERVEAIGNIEAPIIVANNGDIGSIISTAGDIGGARPETSAPPSYVATPITAGTIVLILGQSIRSDISASEGVKQIESTVRGIRGSLTTPTILNIGGSTPGFFKSKLGCDMQINLTSGLPEGARIIFGTYYGYPLNTSAIRQISLGLPDRLSGQIIVNANNITTWPHEFQPGDEAPAPFFGQVVVSNTGGGTTTIAGSTTATTLTYSNTSQSLGDGAVGLISYHLHANDCDPVPNWYGSGEGVLETAFTPPSDNTARPIVVVIGHYGPIKRASGVSSWNSAVEVACQPLNSSHEPVCSLWETVDNPFDFVGPGDSGWVNSRAIGVRRKSGVFPRPGYYRVQIGNSGTAIVSDGTDLGSPPAVVWPAGCETTSPPLAYVFKIAPDCDSDLVNDETDPPTGCTADCDMADFNNSETVSVQDLFDFLAAFFQQTP